MRPISCHILTHLILSVSFVVHTFECIKILEWIDIGMKYSSEYNLRGKKDIDAANDD